MRLILDWPRTFSVRPKARENRLMQVKGVLFDVDDELFNYAAAEEVTSPGRLSAMVPIYADVRDPGR